MERIVLAISFLLGAKINVGYWAGFYAAQFFCRFWMFAEVPWPAVVPAPPLAVQLHELGAVGNPNWETTPTSIVSYWLPFCAQILMWLWGKRNGVEQYLQESIKENLHHLWVMLPGNEIVLMTMAAHVASFHLSKARTARKYSKHFSGAWENPSWHLFVVQVRSGF